MPLTVEDIALDRSPDRGAHVRLSARVRTGGGGGESYWFEVPGRHAEAVTTGPDPWLVLLLPLAAATGEDLELPGEADAALVRGARELVRIWDCWYPWTERVEVRVAEAGAERSGGTGRTVAFFSGGVDSFYTLLRHEEEPGDGDAEEVDDLLTVCGFDIPVGEEEACRSLFRSAGDVARARGKSFVPVSTNLRETGWNPRTPWQPLGFGPALVACAHVLGERYGRALVPAGTGYARMSPKGSHPLTDPLMGSSRLRIVHDGAAAGRIEKTRRVAGSDLARRHLRVCWRSRAAHNCSTCEKCYRTMLALELLGELDRFATFDRGRLDMPRVPRVLMRKKIEIIFWRELEELAEEEGDEDAARRIRAALSRSRIKRGLLGLADRLDRLPGVWRASRWLRGLVRARSVV